MELKRHTCTNCGKVFIAKDRNYRPTCSVECGVARVRWSLLRMAQAFMPEHMRVNKDR